MVLVCVCVCVCVCMCVHACTHKHTHTHNLAQPQAVVLNEGSVRIVFPRGSEQFGQGGTLAVCTEMGGFPSGTRLLPEQFVNATC